MKEILQQKGLECPVCGTFYSGHPDLWHRIGSVCGDYSISPDGNPCKGKLVPETTQDNRDRLIQKSVNKRIDRARFLLATLYRDPYEEKQSGTKHTPGPWLFCGSHVDDSDGAPLVRTARDFESLNCFDIHLIAAAPDLLAACEAALAQLVKYGENRYACAAFESERKLIAQLRAAIAKAKGGTP